MEDFEKGKKKVISHSIEDTVSLKSSKMCPWDRNHFNEVCNEIKSGVELMKNGNLVVSTNLIAKMIGTVAAQIAEHICKMLQEVELNSLDAILLVGGFANSPIILKTMKELVGEAIRLIVPENSELCVVKGAVLFGWKTDIIRSRKSRYTYGFGGSRPFIDGKHDESRSFIDNKGKKWCDKSFKKLVSINDDVPIDKCVESIGVHPHSNINYTCSALYCSEDTDPNFCDVKGVELIGKIIIPNSKEKYGRRIIKHVYFGDTEIYVKITDEATGEMYEKRFDFLSVRDVKLLG